MIDDQISILVVDDSEFMRHFIVGFLKEAGFKMIHCASNGIQAVEKYKKDPADIILMDILMPEQDGITTLKEFQALGAKVIMISAIGQKSMIDRALEIGAIDYLIKPFFTADEIATKIRSAVNT
ncbi:MAG: two-component system response regulator [Candidatus Pacebacteria bacterium CG10_big_fil_rev_8_21_14_0_10_42_12]|nr:response regulator [Candidatus Parcubacteria bacterium]NCS66777.1 response regulator [Candidatus Peregrinibacteria bacterium]PIR62728.1 MAG: two-component system response regulator [Candidatus Pacebacteria bacterium CG10_big_fil_rev_8_21_14_0_10_42_12]